MVFLQRRYGGATSGGFAENRRRAVGLVFTAVLLALTFPTSADAQATSSAIGTIDLGTNPGPFIYNSPLSSMTSWAQKANGAAITLFGLLFTLEMVLFGIHAALFLKGESPGKMFSNLAMKFLGGGFFLYLISSAGSLIPKITGSLGQLGSDSTGSSSSLMQTILTIGAKIAQGFLQAADSMRGVDVYNAFSQGTFSAGGRGVPGLAMTAAFAHAIDECILAAMALLVVASMAVIFMTWVAITMEAGIVMSGGVVFLGFAGTRFTMPFAQGYLRYVLNVGGRLLAYWIVLAMENLFITQNSIASMLANLSTLSTAGQLAATAQQGGTPTGGPAPTWTAQLYTPMCIAFEFCAMAFITYTVPMFAGKFMSASSLMWEKGSSNAGGNHHLLVSGVTNVTNALSALFDARITALRENKNEKEQKNTTSQAMMTTRMDPVGDVTPVNINPLKTLLPDAQEMKNNATSNIFTLSLLSQTNVVKNLVKKEISPPSAFFLSNMPQAPTADIRTEVSGGTAMWSNSHSSEVHQEIGVEEHGHASVTENSVVAGSSVEQQIDQSDVVAPQVTEVRQASEVRETYLHVAPADIALMRPTKFYEFFEHADFSLVTNAQRAAIASRPDLEEMLSLLERRAIEEKTEIQALESAFSYDAQGNLGIPPPVAEVHQKVVSGAAPSYLGVAPADIALMRPMKFYRFFRNADFSLLTNAQREVIASRPELTEIVRLLQPTIIEEKTEIQAQEWDPLDKIESRPLSFDQGSGEGAVTPGVEPTQSHFRLSVLHHKVATPTSEAAIAYDAQGTLSAQSTSLGIIVAGEQAGFALQKNSSQSTVVKLRMIDKAARSYGAESRLVANAVKRVGSSYREDWPKDISKSPLHIESAVTVQQRSMDGVSAVQVRRKTPVTSKQ